MCILFIAVNQHPNYPLIICANRDEFHQRPTQSMHWWQDNEKSSRIIAGKDLEAGGTWLGIKENGLFSALTNYRQISNTNSSNKETDTQFSSRGELVINALNDTSFSVEQLINRQQSYQGYNLIFGPWQQLVCFDSVNQQLTTLKDGYHSICNGALDDIWPKMANGKQALENYIKKKASTQSPICHSTLLSMMKNEQVSPDHALPKTGLSIEWERRLSAIFIKSAEYGTRSTCIISIDNQHKANVTDIGYDNAGKVINQQDFLLTL